MNRPNILLITTDQQRFETIGVNGNDWIKTPHLDQLARRGVNFAQAHVQNTVCIPSRACIQTGRYTHQHGVNYMDTVIDDTPGLPEWETTFMQQLQAGGYHTVAFGKIHMFPHKGFDEMQVTGGKGERWVHSSGMEIGLAPLGRDYAIWLERRHPGAYEMIYEQRRHPDYRRYKTAIRNVLPFEEYVDSWIGQNTVDFLDRPHDRPFFAWCGFCGPHGPMDPPAPYDDMYPHDRMPLPPNYQLDLQRLPRPTTPGEDALARRYCSHYYGQVSLIDHWFGRIMETLRARGLLENTLVLFTSDHGEMLFEFGRLGKALFYEPVTHVPLIIVPPGGVRRSRQDVGLAEVFDVAPTILDYAGVRIPDKMAAATLRPRVEGEAAGKTAVLCHFVTNDRAATGACLRTQDAKYIQWNNGAAPEFYDLRNDPLERCNRIADPSFAAAITGHQQLLIERMLTTPH